MFDLFAATPAAARLGLTLLAIVLLMRARVPMGAAFLAGCGLIALLFPMSGREFLFALWAGIISQESIFLTIVVVSILVFSAALNAAGQIDRIIASFKAVVGESRAVLVAFPALIGLLPMPGGAIFSAPMVAAAAKSAAITPEQAAISNYWFRHIWEYWFPFYPGVILALTLTEVPAARFIALQFPMTIVSLAVGYALILHRIRLGGMARRDFSRTSVMRFAIELSPILIVVGALAILDPLAAIATQALGIRSFLLRRLPIVLGLVFGGVWLGRYRGLTVRTVADSVWKRNVLEIASLALGTMMFKSVIEHCGAVTALHGEFTAWHVPIPLAVCGLPFVAGLVGGLAIAFVGASFPLVIALVEPLDPSARLPYYGLAYSFGYIGMMLSPVHLCLILTNEYFKSSLLRAYGYLFPLCIVVGAAAWGLFVAYRLMLGAL